MKNIHENLTELVEETKDEPIPLTLDKYQVKKLLETNGATPEKLEEFEQRYAQVEDGPGTSFVAANVVNTRSFEIKTPDVSIKVAPDKTHLVENRMIEGRPCIVITISEHVEINGISVCCKHTAVADAPPVQQKLQRQHNPPAIHRDRGATVRSGVLPLHITSHFLQILPRGGATELRYYFCIICEKTHEHR